MMTHWNLFNALERRESQNNRDIMSIPKTLNLVELLNRFSDSLNHNLDP